MVDTTASVEKPEISAPRPALPDKPWWVWGVIFAVVLGIGVARRYIVAPEAVNSYEECVNVKGSVVTMSYPGTCITRDGRRFIQSLTEEEQVVCGGWDTGGEIVCDCSGKLIKPDCPSGTICDSGDYFCQGQCGSCCWRGTGDDVQYGGPYPVCDSDSVKLSDQVCELNREHESNAVDGPDCQCPAGFQPEIVEMSWGPCPGDGRIKDCPRSRFKCSEEKVTSGAEGKYCGGIAGNLPENQCPIGYYCQLEGNYPDASGKCMAQ